jgi:hypothetical protein
MKTIKIYLSIVGFALSSICFGQLLSQNNSDPLFYSALYNLSSNRMEHRVDPFPARSISGDHFEAPHLSRTFYIPREFDMGIDAWMTKPFESDFYEDELLLEAWMVSPFESSYYEEDPIIEVWMTKPFESDFYDEEIEIEAWMTTIWI